MTFDYRDADGDTFIATNNKTDAGQPVVWMSTSLDGVYVDLDHVEEVVAGIRDAARTAARQTTGQDDTKPCVCDTEPEACTAVGEVDPTTADDPTPLRWGHGDVEHGDDDTVTVYLSGPDREPYWLELDPERAAAFRRDLAPTEPTPCICGHQGQRHIEDACQDCECGDYLEPADARAVIERWRTAALNARAELAAVGQLAEAHDTDRAACACSHPQERHNSACAHCPCIGYAATWPPLTPEDQAVETLAAADTVEDER